MLLTFLKKQSLPNKQVRLSDRYDRFPGRTIRADICLDIHKLRISKRIPSGYQVDIQADIQVDIQADIRTDSSARVPLYEVRLG